MSNPMQANREMTPSTRRAVLLWIAQSAGRMVGYGALIFLVSGRLDWLWGWVYFAVTGAGLMAHPLVLVLTNPSLLVERSRGVRPKGTKAWDRWVVIMATALLYGSMVVASLHVRSAGPAHGPLALNLVGLSASVLGWGVFLWAMASNAYFATGVRIQSERGHTVSTGGPYRFVRHPGYIGSMLIVLGTPALLGSLYGVAVAAISALLFVVRTALEDRTLHTELPGYAEYAQQTRYRLIPGVW